VCCEPERRKHRERDCQATGSFKPTLNVHAFYSLVYELTGERLRDAKDSYRVVPLHTLIIERWQEHYAWMQEMAKKGPMARILRYVLRGKGLVGWGWSLCWR